MQFRYFQRQSRRRTAWLVLCFVVLLLALAGFVNLVLALGWRLIMPIGQGLPALFIETNTALLMLLTIGGALVELERLRSGGGIRVAHWLGGVEVRDDGDASHRRLLNVVDEMAIASGQPAPRVFVMPREDGINAFVAGWGPADLALCVTRGALERLNRAELQGLVAHEFGHIENDDLPLSMHLLALVWGLSLVHGYGRKLMDSDNVGRVAPQTRIVGGVFAAAGWLGWLVGQVLQASVSREREFLADACAIQYTRTRDGLGNVLRKIWHDQQLHAGGMQNPASAMIAAFLLHDSPRVSWLASHPPLQARIKRICGAVLPPLPAPRLRPESPEPRRVPAEPAPILAADHAEREALQRLRRMAGPTEQRLIVLALLMNPGNERELKLWNQIGEGVLMSGQILQDVGLLPPQRRMPEFDRLTASMAHSPMPERRILVEQARDLLRADGRVSPRDRLWWLVLRHRMGSHQHGGQAFMRPLTGQGQDLDTLDELQRHHVHTMSAYLARLIPTEHSETELPARNQAWLKAVKRRVKIDQPPTGENTAPPTDVDPLAHAIAGLQEMSWILRPQLLKAWVEEAVNHSPQGLMSHDTADVLRLMAGLLDAPMPPMLETHYRGT